MDFGAIILFFAVASVIMLKRETVHPAVDLKSKETFSCCAILVGCIESSAHLVADLKLRHHASNQRLMETS
jgi:hypothetical protein